VFRRDDSPVFLNLLSELVTKTAGRPAAEYAKAALGDKIGAPNLFLPTEAMNDGDSDGFSLVGVCQLIATIRPISSPRSGTRLVGGRQPSAKHPINSGNRGGDGVPSRSIATGTKAAATRAAAVAGAAGGPGTFVSEPRVEAGTLTARGESSLLAPPLEALRDTLRDVAAGIPAFAEPAVGTVGGGAGGAPDTRRTLDNLVWVSARRQIPQP